MTKKIKLNLVVEIEPRLLSEIFGTGVKAQPIAKLSYAQLTKNIRENMRSIMHCHANDIQLVNVVERI